MTLKIVLAVGHNWAKGDRGASGHNTTEADECSKVVNEIMTHKIDGIEWVKMPYGLGIADRCKWINYDGIMTRYYPTHQMPKDSFEMIVATKPKQSIWTMNETPDPTDVWCQLYYHTVNKTPRGYQKIIEGMSNKFLVNQ